MTPEERARHSLDGLSVGDAFGERLFGAPDAVLPRIEQRYLALGPWPYTDDTEMAISLGEMLEFSQTVSALGDRDTTCAIVGGIVALRAGRECIPSDWLSRREALPDFRSA